MEDSLFNIPRSNTDEICKYKMHELIIEYDNSRTNLLNIYDIANELDRPTELLVKYLCVCLNVNGLLNNKINKYSLYGIHQKDTLLDLLDNFIADYVVCLFCYAPETYLYCKNNKLRLKCYACGHNKKFNVKTKIDTFVLKYIAKTPYRPSKKYSNKKIDDVYQLQILEISTPTIMHTLVYADQPHTLVYAANQHTVILEQI